MASYNVFDKKLFFSDESDTESPEEIYTEGDDSDDDWDVPKKKSKKQPKNKLVKQLKLNAEDAVRRKKKSRKKNESEPAVTTGNESSDTHTMEIDDTNIKKEEELDIMDSITTTNSQEYNTFKEDDKSKSEQKIKVIDLARLQNSSESFAKRSNVETTECAPMPRIVSQGTLRVSSQNTGTMNAVPLMNNSVISPSAPPDSGNTFSSVHPTAFAIVGQPQVISNAYIITTNQSPFQANAAPQYQMQPFATPAYRGQVVPNAATGTVQNSRMPRIVNPSNTYINQAPSNNKLVLVNQNAPVRFSPSTSQQVVRPPSNFVNKPARFRPNQTQPTFNRQISPSFPVKNNYGRNIIASKLGRNITVIPKVINKINERGNSFKEIEGAIGIHSNNGALQYVVNLANGTHVPLTNEQVQKLREGNNGALPLKLKIPVPMDVAEKIEPCVVIDD